MIVLAKNYKGYCCTMCCGGGCVRVPCPGEGCKCAEVHGHRGTELAAENLARWEERIRVERDDAGDH